MRENKRLGSAKAKRVFQLIRKGAAAKAELLERSGLSVSTLTRTLEELQGQGWIRETGLGASTGGRRPFLYEVRPEAGYAYGLDISRMQARLVLCDLGMQRLASAAWPMDETVTPAVLAGQVTEAAVRLRTEAAVPEKALLGIGIGAVGPLSPSAGVLLRPLHFPASGWENVPIARMLEERLALPALLDNGANTAIRGEYWADRVRDFRHLLYLHVGVGVRSAVMSDGKIVYGAVDMEGAVGQMIIQASGVPHREPGGNSGALESYASLYAVERDVKALLREGHPSVLAEWVRSPEQVTFPLVMKALAENDPLAVEAALRAASSLGIGLANLLNILHPEKVILGGPLIGAHELFFRTATQAAVKQTYYYPEYQVVFSRGRLGDEAIAVGAAVMVLDALAD
ncbi:transcriptional regulator [Paenibacillus sp. J31TS4]|uniref:ROK family protein n=1 Tax=Paenibacillus sp. J31TS4 TaxID=2807195 RepID=UPI001B222821|nr:ROK family protein [Paenibacillus sp. J31TS4]GIP39341.1 transcriptional regulator [Paenibacillus sp. J31TS4]